MEKSSFFNSVNGDRKYKAEDFAAYFGSFISNGIFPNPADNLRVISNNDMTVTLKPGKAWINGYFYMNDDDLILPIDAADGVLDRIDRVVIRLDYVNREIRAYVKKGTFASNPVAPSLQRNMDIYELCVAEIKVNKGAVSILQSNITDTRFNLDVCGVTNSLITVDIGIITEQFEEDFIEWFEAIKGTLDGDVAGNLYNLIEQKVDIDLFNAHKADKTHWKKLDEVITNVATIETILQLPRDYNQLKILCKEVKKSPLPAGSYVLRLSTNVNFDKISMKSNVVKSTANTNKIADENESELPLNDSSFTSFVVEIDNNLDVDSFANIKANLYNTSATPINVWGSVRSKANKITTLTLTSTYYNNPTYEPGVVFEIWGR